MTAYSNRGSSLNGEKLMIDLTGRVNFLDMKNKKIEKNVTQCINFLKQSRFSPDKSKKSSLDKTLVSSRSQQQFRMTKRNYVKRQDIQTVNQGLLQKKFALSSQRKQLRDNRNAKTLRGFAERSIRTQPYPDNYTPINTIFTSQTKKQQKAQQQPEATKAFMKKLVKSNNFIMQPNHNKHNSTLLKISQKQRQQRQQKKRQQQRKLIQLKQKLLEEEERTIEEFENCVLYKQKLMQKLKSEDRLKNILNRNTMFKVKHQNQVNKQ